MRRSATGLRSDDTGAMLVIALLLITVVAVVTGVLLTVGNTKFLATIGLRQVASDSYAADAAAKAAIDNIETGYSKDPTAVTPLAPGTSWVFNNSGFDGCFGKDSNGPVSGVEMKDVMPAVGTAKAGSAYVQCTPVVGTGIYGSAVGQPVTGGGSGGSGGSGAKGQALITVGSGTSTDGINLQALSGTNFLIRGSLASWSTLAASPNKGSATATGDVTAVSGACTNVSTVAGTVTCPGPKVAVADSYDTRMPGLTLQSVPSCVGGVASFSPGYYDDSVALSTVTSSCALNYFSPGTYYFDFRNNPSDATYSPGAVTATNATFTTPDVWQIGTGGAATVKLVGGTKSSTYPAMPGACLSPIDSSAATPNTGVQFVFGGDSRMLVGNNASVELCASTTTSGRPVAVSGLTSQSATSSATTASGNIAPASGATVTPTPTAGSANTTSAALGSADGNAATYSTNSNGNNSWSLSVTGFDLGSTSIPAGSMLKSVQVVVRHQEPATNGNAPSVQFGTTTLSGTTLSPSTMKTDTLSLAPSPTDTNWTSLAAAVANGTAASALTNLKITFGESMKKGTESLDQLNVVLTYYPPSLRNLGVAETGLSAGTTDISSNCMPATCSVFSTGGGSSYKGSFWIQGAVYTPTGPINVSLGNQSGGDAFRYGLVAWGFTAKMLNSYPQGQPLVSIPDQGPGFGRNVTIVDLTVYVCGSSDVCPSGSGTKALTARVEFSDPTTAAAAPNTRKISILSWAEQK